LTANACDVERGNHFKELAKKDGELDGERLYIFRAEDMEAAVDVVLSLPLWQDIKPDRGECKEGLTTFASNQSRELCEYPDDGHTEEEFRATYTAMIREEAEFILEPEKDHPLGLSIRDEVYGSTNSMDSNELDELLAQRQVEESKRLLGTFAEVPDIDEEDVWIYDDASAEELLKGVRPKFALLIGDPKRSIDCP